MKKIELTETARRTLPYAALCAVATVVLTAIRWYYMAKQFDVTERYDTAKQLIVKGGQHYLYGCHATGILTVGAAITVALLATMLFVPLTRGIKTDPHPENASARAMNVTCALAFLALPTGYVLVSRPTFGILTVVTLVLSVLAAIPCALAARKTQNQTILFDTGLALSLFWMARVFLLYFDRSFSNTSPLRIAEQTAVLAALLFSLAELRELRGRSRPRLWFFTAFTAILLLAVSSAPVLAVGILQKWTFSVPMLFAVLEFCFLCLIGVKVVLVYCPKKWEEILNYLVFGVLTTAVNLLVFFPLTRVMDELIANVIAWIVGVLFAFVTNKFLVFESRERALRLVVRELSSFTVARLISLGAEELILLILIKGCGVGTGVTKLIAAVVVILLNYVFSKLLIFRKKQETPPPTDAPTAG